MGQWGLDQWGSSGGGSSGGGVVGWEQWRGLWCESSEIVT